MNVIRSSSRLSNLLSAGVRSGQVHHSLSQPLLLAQTQTPYLNHTFLKFISTFDTSHNHLQPGIQNTSTDGDITWTTGQTVSDVKPTLQASESASPPGQAVGKTDEGGDSDGKPSDDELKRIGNILVKEVSQLLISRPDYTLYSTDIVLEDNIRNKTFVGSALYINQMSLAKIYFHLRYVYARITVDSVAADFDDSAVIMKWSITGLGALKLLLRYIPRKMWQRQNMEANADLVASGISTYYIRDSKVVKHVLDVREVDREGKVLAKADAVEQIKAKVAKLKPNVPAPAMYKKVDESPDKSPKVD